MNYTQNELMIATASREIRDKEIVMVGMRLPLLAFQVAKNLHAPRAIGLFEIGLIRDRVVESPLYLSADLPNLSQALWATSVLDIMSLLQKGKVDLGFIGGAEIDKFGNLNTTYIGGYQNPSLRLPGGGGGSDIASLAKRWILIMAHEKRRFKPKVDYITSPGYGTGGEWRKKEGIEGEGPLAVITTLGILRFEPDSKEMYLDSLHPGVSPREVKENTGWKLKIPKELKETPPPTSRELEIIRKHDPLGLWSKG